jgi:phosphoribosylaminoimidazole-succinocarboxamide synthase
MFKTKADYGQKLYEGKAKIVYKTSSGSLVHFYKDSATAFNAEKKAEFEGKGELNNQMSCWLFESLAAQDIKTHFIKQVDERSFESLELNIIPIEVVTRNIAAGSILKRSDKKEGEAFETPLVEFFLKDDAKGDPLMSEEELIEMGHTQETLDALREKALEVNKSLSPVFEKAGLKLVDFKLEFGRNAKDEIILGDEISPDTCRLWDIKTGEKLDKDRFRFDLGDLLTGYKEVHARLKKVLNK